MKKFIFYDKEQDILSIHKGFANNESFEGNIDFGNLVLDVSTKGKIKGIEILNAGVFLKNLNIEGEVLNVIEDADFRAIVNHKLITVEIKLKFKNKNLVEMKIPIRA